MKANWSPSLSLGVDAIDEQHKEIFLHVAELETAVNEGRGPGVATLLMDFLVGYVAHHFADEEKLMAEHEYPKLETHKAAHEGFRVALEELRVESSGNPTPAVVERLSALTTDWLVRHISWTDREFATWLKGRYGG